KVDGYPNRWELTHLRRGLKNTTTAVAGHGANERVVFLSDSVLFIKMDLSYSGMEIKYKLVTSGQSLTDAAEIDFTWDAVGVLPEAVTSLSCFSELSTARAN